MTLIAECLQVHSSYSQLYFATCITLCFSNKLNLLSVTSDLTCELLNVLPATN